MTGSSPPTRRVVDIIEFFTQRSDVPTRLSDVVQALGLNQATTYTILKELVDAEWLVRDATSKTFTIGNGLVRLAQKIDESASITHAANAAAVEIALSTGYAASVSERVGDQLVITAFVGGHHDAWTGTAGDRLPFAAPFGPAFAAWEPTDERREWIRRSGVASRTFEGQLIEQLDEIRELGFSVECLTPEMASAIPIMTKIQAETMSSSMRTHLRGAILEMTRIPKTPAETAERQDYYVGAMAAPIFNTRGRVTHNICLHPFTTLKRRKSTQLGKQLMRLAETIGPKPG